MDSLATRVGQRVRQLRLARGLKQKDVADRMGVTPAEISRIETAKRTPLLGTLERLAAALNVEPIELFLFEGLDPQAMMRIVAARYGLDE